MAEKIIQEKIYGTEEKEEFKEIVEQPKYSLNVYPFILVNIGSGVSILQVIGPSKYQRVAGTMIGGGTLLGLARLLIGVSDFDSIVQLSQKGSIGNVDLLIKDIYQNTEE